MNKRTILSVLVLVAMFAFPLVAMADPLDAALEGNAITLRDIVELVRSIMNYGIVLATLAIIAMIVYGGFKMATSAGNETEYGKGKTILFQAIKGALVVFGVGLIVNTIANVAYDPTRAIR